METNIYVAKGLLAPYGLKVDATESGFTAIDKVKRGNVYDIIFMDHMMPKMDGIEATKIIRSLGYKQPIVALTANAVIGQAELFLSNGFDDFISKPIDIRQLNTVLNKLMRDKQPPEVIEAARQQVEAKKDKPSEKKARADIEPRFVEIFVRDATKAITVLDAVYEKRDAFSDEDLRAYTINTHGIKSALAIIGEMELSAFALKLEDAGRSGDINVILSDTPVFLHMLRTLIEDLVPTADEAGKETMDDDSQYLNENLNAVKAACEMYDKKTAKNVMTQMREKTWSKPVTELLDTITEHLLHSDFDEVVNAVDEFKSWTGQAAIPKG